MKKVIGILTLVIAVIAFTSVAHAAMVSVTYDFTGLSSSSEWWDHDFTQDGLVVTATAQTLVGGNWVASKVTGNGSLGLGVEYNNETQDLIDGDPDDRLIMTFLKPVTLTQLNLRDSSTGEDFDLYVDDMTTKVLSDYDVPGGNLVNMSYLGSQFGIAVDTHLEELGLAGMTVEYDDAAPVPEPMSILLFGTGLVGLFFKKRLF